MIYRLGKATIKTKVSHLGFGIQKLFGPAPWFFRELQGNRKNLRLVSYSLMYYFTTFLLLFVDICEVTFSRSQYVTHLGFESVSPWFLHNIFCTRR
jgi:hypothetical protein